MNNESFQIGDQVIALETVKYYSDLDDVETAKIIIDNIYTITNIIGSVNVQYIYLDNINFAWWGNRFKLHRRKETEVKVRKLLV